MNALENYTDEQLMAELTRRKEEREMPKHIRKCSVCSAKCVGEFGETPHHVTDDGVKMPKYIVAGYDYSGQGTVFCETCDWKCSQVLLGNTSAWNEFAHEFTKEHINKYNLLCEGDCFVTEVKRLKRNETARLRRLREKKSMDRYEKAKAEGRI